MSTFFKLTLSHEILVKIKRRCLPTVVSRKWYQENNRELCTTVTEHEHEAHKLFVSVRKYWIIYTLKFSKIVKHFFCNQVADSEKNQSYYL